MDLQTQTVEVQSAWSSKINWTQAATALLTLAAAFGLPLTDDQRIALLTCIGIFGPAITAWLRTFKTSTITPSVAKKMQ